MRHLDCAEAAVSASRTRHLRCPLCRQPVTLMGEADGTVDCFVCVYMWHPHLICYCVGSMHFLFKRNQPSGPTHLHMHVRWLMALYCATVPHQEATANLFSWLGFLEICESGNVAKFTTHFWVPDGLPVLANWSPFLGSIFWMRIPRWWNSAFVWVLYVHSVVSFLPRWKLQADFCHGHVLQTGAEHCIAQCVE